MKDVIIWTLILLFLVWDVLMLYSCIRINRVKDRRLNNGKKHM